MGHHEHSRLELLGGGADIAPESVTFLAADSGDRYGRFGIAVSRQRINVVQRCQGCPFEDYVPEKKED